MPHVTLLKQVTFMFHTEDVQSRWSSYGKVTPQNGQTLNPYSCLLDYALNIAVILMVQNGS